MPLSSLRFSKMDWAGECAKLIQSAIEVLLDEKGQCSIMLTGGRSARSLYKAWQSLPNFSSLKNLDIFWGDERCVSSEDSESNYRMVLDTLFNGNPFPEGKRLFRMDAESEDLATACIRYEQELPEKIDIILLSVGEDGHVASLFPGSPALLEERRRIMPVTGPKPPFRRLTITPSVIRTASQIFVLAPGSEKAAIYTRLSETEVKATEIPARLVESGIWLMDNLQFES